jgi:hypothetical protein
VQSSKALSDSLARHDAFVSNVRMSDYGYWVVTFSCAPGLTMSIMMCHTGITQQQAAYDATMALAAQTGQKVVA